jgi:hypothetical protein
MEQAYRQALIISNGSNAIFVEKPISLALLLCAIAFLFLPMILKKSKQLAAARAPAEEGACRIRTGWVRERIPVLVDGSSADRCRGLQPCDGLDSAMSCIARRPAFGRRASVHDALTKFGTIRTHFGKR